MPRLVLIAKNTYVWLDQLSKKYQRAITRLDQIPDEELDTLARWGFTGLWLIGLWERSTASQRIKQHDAATRTRSPRPIRCTTTTSPPTWAATTPTATCATAPGSAASAWPATWCPTTWASIRSWVIEHPDWFVALRLQPLPVVHLQRRRTCPGMAGVGIYLEDHYFDHSDAAVVFKRVDQLDGRHALHLSRQRRHHPCPGTTPPSSTTCKPEVREAVIQTILHVARKFPIIRFDAAMTLAKQPLPAPVVPRAGQRRRHPLARRTRPDQRAVRRRHARRSSGARWSTGWPQEAPDTLLLAEAFWLMEGYFVRTLGMHRVYNSAFMNMLRDEENAKYRMVIKNTLEFDPEILKRYVNFMNNPDERTAVEQFGKGDKYFGICIADGHPARPAHVRPRPDRGLHREVRHGIPPRLLGRAARRRPGRAPRARDLPAAAQALPVCRGARTSCCTISSPPKGT